MAYESLNKGQKRTYGSTSAMDPEGEIGFAGPSGFFDERSFLRSCDKITSNIYQIAKHASNLEQTLKTIGTRNDTDALRESVHTVTTTALQTITETTSHLKQITSMTQQRGVIVPEKEKETKLRVTRLTSDFQQAVQKFTDNQKKIVAKMKTTAPMNTSISSESHEDHSQSLLDAEAAQQAQLQMQQQIEFEQGLLLERENRIRQIETDIVDVNDIMKELATLVVEQGSAVDSIEGNIDSAYTQVETGRGELAKAETYQSKYRKKLCCLLVVGLVILVVIIVILVTQLSH